MNSYETLDSFLSTNFKHIKQLHLKLTFTFHKTKENLFHSNRQILCTSLCMLSDSCIDNMAICTMSCHIRHIHSIVRTCCSSCKDCIEFDSFANHNTAEFGQVSQMPLECKCQIFSKMSEYRKD